MRKLVLLVFFFGIIIFTYLQLPNTFYQQDEWAGVGYILTEDIGTFFSRYSFTNILIGGGRPLSMPIQYLFYGLFPFQTWPFALFAVSFHFLNTILLFLLVKKIFKNDFIAIISGLFFATASVSQQAVTWIAASTTTLPAASFSFLSIISYLNFIKLEKKKYLYLSLLCLIIGSLFKESSFFLIIFLPLVYIIFKDRLKLKSFLKAHTPFLIYIIPVLTFLLIRIFFQKNQTGFIVSASQHAWEKTIFHFIFYPFESLSQIFVPGNIIYPLSDLFIRSNYSRIWNNSSAILIKETIAADFISVFISSFILLLVGLVYLKNKAFRKPLVFGLVFIFSSFLPFLIFDKQTAYFESRFYYLGVAGAGILFAVFFDSLRLAMTKKISLPLKYSTIFVLVLVFAFIIYQVSLTQKYLQEQVILACERKDFLASVSQLYPTLPNKPVFYITGNHDYYVVGQKAPFQQGMGYTLMVWYYKTGTIPSELIKQQYLWGILDEGYREVGGKGFGYFWDFSKLKEEIASKNITKDNVFAFFYMRDENKLVDITDNIRGELVKQSE